MHSSHGPYRRKRKLKKETIPAIRCQAAKFTLMILTQWSVSSKGVEGDIETKTVMKVMMKFEKKTQIRKGSKAINVTKSL